MSAAESAGQLSEPTPTCEIEPASDVMLRNIGYRLVSDRYRKMAGGPSPTAEEITGFVDEFAEKVRRGWTPPPAVQGPPSAEQAIDHTKEDLLSRTMFLMFRLKRLSDQYILISLRERTDRVERQVAQAMLSKLLTFVWGLNQDARFDVDLGPLERLVGALHDVESGENNRMLMAGEPAARLSHRSYSERSGPFCARTPRLKSNCCWSRKWRRGQSPRRDALPR